MPGMHDTSDSPISLRRIRGFHVGGTRRHVEGFPVQTLARVPGDAPVTVDMNGDHMVGQLYATHYQQERRACALPVLLWHGGGLTGACWDETPDGRPGWLEYFLRAGYDVVVSDAFERGRASFPAYPQVLPGPPEHRSIDAVWHHFRFGAEGAYPGGVPARDLRNAAYPGCEFPVEAIEQFGRQFVARWAGTQDYALQAYAALLRETGPCVVIGHSQGAAYALQCAQRHPDLVRAVVAIEPPLTQGYQPAPVQAPHLFVWGDFIEGASPTWTRYQAAAERYRLGLAAGGCIADVLDLPAQGIRGNSHMLIMDRNSLSIAQRVHAWLARVAP